MKDDVHKEALQKLAEKSELEQTLAVGLQGPPQIKAEEKANFLGQYRERILKSLTKIQVMEKSIYPEIEEALQDERASILLVHGDINFKHRDKYQKLASGIGKPYTIVHDPGLKGDIGLVVASDHAVNVDNITI